MKLQSVFATILAAALPLFGVEELNEKDFQVEGDTIFGDLGALAIESMGKGFRLSSQRDANEDGKLMGSISRTYEGLKAEGGRWYSLRIRGLAQEGFQVEKNNLYMKVAFFSDRGTDNLDLVKKKIYDQVERERIDLRDEGTNRKLGHATWRHYELVFRTPFPEVDRIVATVGFANGAGKGRRSGFWINDFELKSVSAPAVYEAPGKPKTVTQPKDIKELVKLGGRWYYDPRGSSKKVPAKFDHTTSDRLLYLSDRLEAPFAGNLSSWLRQGWLDLDRKLVREAVYVPDNVVITFSEEHLVMKAKNLPNHPTALFPDFSRSLDGNPNYIGEQKNTWYLPLVPKRNPNPMAMDKGNTTRALAMGPIGIAANGVVFYNPFDHIAEADAVWRLDRCCGHPSPNSQYHYHKYPVCVKSPWVDDGEGHSPVIGFAFDGYPVYGPYEAKGVLAKNSKEKPLNAFNVHQDDKRGWHYHVTPGHFPHIIGGYWGVMDERNRRARGPRPGGPRRPPSRFPRRPRP